MFNPLVINPAYAGSRDQMSVVILHRSQWLGFGGGAPNTQTASFHAPLLQGKVGLGAVVTRDVIGPVSRTGFSGAYAYRLRLRTGKLAIALRTGLYNYVFDWNKIEYKDIILSLFLEINLFLFQNVCFWNIFFLKLP